MRAFFVILAMVGVAACTPAPSQSDSTGTAATAGAGGVTVSEGWASPTPGGVDVSAGYMTISNDGGADDQLIAASSPRAERVEIHEMTMDGAVMRMRPVQGLTIPAGGSVTLQQGGLHLMFFGVSEPFVAGENIPVTLSFAQTGDVAVSLAVRPGGAREMHQ